MCSRPGSDYFSKDVALEYIKAILAFLDLHATASRVTHSVKVSLLKLIHKDPFDTQAQPVDLSSKYEERERESERERETLQGGRSKHNIYIYIYIILIIVILIVG